MIRILSALEWHISSMEYVRMDAETGLAQVDEYPVRVNHALVHVVDRFVVWALSGRWIVTQTRWCCRASRLGLLAWFPTWAGPREYRTRTRSHDSRRSHSPPK